jgi:inosine/guanosine/xanthosine phosphorylase family protein
VLAVILGSGFGTVRHAIQTAAELPSESLPGFPNTGVDGHSGKVIVGTVGKVPVLALCGRCHFYEGHSLATVTFPVRVLAECGIRTLLLTNAAGGINPKLRPGDFMCLTDHLNFMGANPLQGAAPPDGKSRFVDLSQTYDRALNKLLAKAARTARVRLHEGVYAAVAGPCYETPAEIRAFAALGADAVGMSTVPEAIVARQCGLRVAGLSCITNWAAGLGPNLITHAEVLAAGARSSEQATALITGFIQLVADAEGGCAQI